MNFLNIFFVALLVSSLSFVEHKFHGDHNTDSYFRPPSSRYRVSSIFLSFYKLEWIVIKYKTRGTSDAPSSRLYCCYILKKINYCNEIEKKTDRALLTCLFFLRGVFVRIKEKNLHVECFKCSTCGTSLKNVGYYNINNKLYCDIHAKLVARQNAPAGLAPLTIPP